MRLNIPKWMGIALRDAVIAAMAMLTISALTGYVVYHSASEGLKKEVQSNLLSIAQSASQLLDGDAHMQITKPEDKGSELYEHTRAPFFKLLHANPNIAFIYTVIPKDGKVYFILDSKLIKEGEKDDTSGVMEEYTDGTDTMKQALATQTAMVEDEAYTDEWGTFLSGYAPIRDSKGQFLGIVGADIRLTAYLERLNNVKKSLLIGMVIALVASILSGVGVWIVRNSALKAEEKNRHQQLQMAAMEQSRIEEQQREKAATEKQKREEMQEMAENFEFSVKGMVSQVRVQPHKCNPVPPMSHALPPIPKNALAALQLFPTKPHTALRKLLPQQKSFLSPSARYAHKPKNPAKLQLPLQTKPNPPSNRFSHSPKHPAR